MNTEYFYILTLRDSVTNPGAVVTATTSGIWTFTDQATRSDAFAVIEEYVRQVEGLAESSSVLFFSLEKNAL